MVTRVLDRALHTDLGDIGMCLILVDTNTLQLKSYSNLVMM